MNTVNPYEAPFFARPHICVSVKYSALFIHIVAMSMGRVVCEWMSVLKAQDEPKKALKQQQQKTVDLAFVGIRNGCMSYLRFALLRHVFFIIVNSGV